MATDFEITWVDELPGTPQQVWDAITVHSVGWLWDIEYQPRVGGAERGLSDHGGTVAAWDPPRHFRTDATHGDWFNEVEYRLEPRAGDTLVRYRHRSTFAEDYDRQLDCCRQHTDFYRHSLGQYVGHFAGRRPVYVEAQAPESSAQGGTDTVLRALGLDPQAQVGGQVRLTPHGLDPIEGVLDYRTDSFVGVRAADRLLRVYGRDRWGWPVAVVNHVFAPGADQAASESAWNAWITGVFATEKVA